MTRFARIRPKLPGSFEELRQHYLAEGKDPDLVHEWAVYASKKISKIKRGRTRDTNRDSFMRKVYKAEWIFETPLRQKGKIRKFFTEEEAQKYADKVTKSKTWEKIKHPRAYADAGVKVASKKLNKRLAGQAYMDRITLHSDFGMDEYTLLHELAHCAGYMHHDLSFRKALVALVSRFMGREEAKQLKAAFKKVGLQMRESKKVMMFDEWNKMRLRMEKARAAREAKKAS